MQDAAHGYQVTFTSGRHRLSDEHRRRLAKYVNDHDVDSGRQLIGVSRETLYRALAGLDLHSSIHFVASAALDALPPAPPSPRTDPAVTQRVLAEIGAALAAPDAVARVRAIVARAQQENEENALLDALEAEQSR